MVPITTYPNDLKTLLETLPGISPNDRSLIERAYYKAEKLHDGQKRKSGEPYFTHCMAVASILAYMKLDAEAIAAGLLHDIVEDTAITIDDLEHEFGKTVAMLVEGVTKLTNLPINSASSENAGKRRSAVNRGMESIRKMLLTMGEDVRVVLIKLADRLHNMRTLGYMPDDKQIRIARETMDIYAPLANRLGIWQMKWELEDLSFRYLNPEPYRAIATSLDERRGDREHYVGQIAEKLQKELEANGIQTANISGRPKHIYSIYSKMQRKNLPLEQIYDVRAVRVIVDEIPQCYLALGLVHNLWRPIPGEFDDYIAAPKDNFYRSLHTAVLDNAGKTVEVQIRTWEMHENAEYGIAAHWRYKEGANRRHDKAFESRLSYLRRLMEFGAEISDDAETFVDAMKSEFFQDRVYAFTPNGDVVDLPVGATPIDFAYHIHTEIGHRCRGAKVHGRLVPLNHTLKMGDQVEILTAKRGGPSMDWLNPDLGYVKTSRVRAKIRTWFRKQNRENHISMGREGLERELKRLGLLDKVSFESVMDFFDDYDKLDDFLSAIGAGDVTGAQISNRILEDERRKKKVSEIEEVLLQPQQRVSSAATTTTGVNITGTGGLLVNLARCCSPMPGDEIIGYVTRGRGVSVHRADCSNIQAIPDVERLIDVTWGGASEEQRYRVPVEVIALDRDGLLHEISTIIADERVNISSVEVMTRQHIATLYLTLEISNPRQLARILARIEMIASVMEARRRNMV